MPIKTIENLHPLQGRTFEGVCAHCGHPFDSDADGRKYGSVPCYLASDSHKAKMEKRYQVQRDKGNKVLCDCGCGTEFHRAPSKLKQHNFYTKSCHRKWLAARFDNHVATGARIRDIQGYDEFLAQAELPCLVEGCKWKGKNLGTHVNLVHGIASAQFKEMAGFNRKTGLIGVEYSRYLSEYGAAHLPNSRGKFLQFGRNKGFKFRKEGMEHHQKARAIHDAT